LWVLPVRVLSFVWTSILSFFLLFPLVGVFPLFIYLFVVFWLTYLLAKPTINPCLLLQQLCIFIFTNPPISFSSTTNTSPSSNGLWPFEQVESSNSYNSTPATVKTGQQLVRSGLLLCFKRSKISSMKFPKNEFPV
jgi:hypothetical protein